MRINRTSVELKLGPVEQFFSHFCSINRTSVELKLMSLCSFHLALTGINRTSVELKRANSGDTFVIFIVLIAPVWN